MGVDEEKPRGSLRARGCRDSCEQDRAVGAVDEWEPIRH